MSVPRPVRVLLLEDSDVDADLVGHRLRAGGLDAAIDRCDDEAGFRAALARGPDVVLADYSLPGFGGEAALRIVREADADLPFVFVTGVLGEETAVEMVRAGATDYVLKQRLARLSPAERRVASAYLLRLKHESPAGRRKASHTMREMNAGRKVRLRDLARQLGHAAEARDALSCENCHGGLRPQLQMARGSK